MFTQSLKNEKISNSTFQINLKDQFKQSNFTQYVFIDKKGKPKTTIPKPKLTLKVFCNNNGKIGIATKKIYSDKAVDFNYNTYTQASENLFTKSRESKLKQSRNDDKDNFGNIGDNLYHSQMKRTHQTYSSDSNNNQINKTNQNSLHNQSYNYNYKYDNTKIPSRLVNNKEKVIVITNVNEKLVEKMNKNSFEAAKRMKYLNTAASEHNEKLITDLGGSYRHPDNNDINLGSNQTEHNEQNEQNDQIQTIQTSSDNELFLKQIGFDQKKLDERIRYENISKFPKMIQNIYYKPKVYSDAEIAHPDRYKKDNNLMMRDYFMYQRAVGRKDVTGKKISDIKHNIMGGGLIETLKRKSMENKPDLLKSLFFRDSMAVKKCTYDD